MESQHFILKQKKYVSITLAALIFLVIFGTLVVVMFSNGSPTVSLKPQKGSTLSTSHPTKPAEEINLIKPNPGASFEHEEVKVKGKGKEISGGGGGDTGPKKNEASGTSAEFTVGKKKIGYNTTTKVSGKSGKLFYVIGNGDTFDASAFGKSSMENIEIVGADFELLSNVQVSDPFTFWTTLRYSSFEKAASTLKLSTGAKYFFIQAEDSVSQQFLLRESDRAATVEQHEIPRQTIDLEAVKVKHSLNFYENVFKHTGLACLSVSGIKEGFAGREEIMGVKNFSEFSKLWSARLRIVKHQFSESNGAKFFVKIIMVHDTRVPEIQDILTLGIDTTINSFLETFKKPDKPTDFQIFIIGKSEDVKKLKLSDDETVGSAVAPK